MHAYTLWRSLRFSFVCETCSSNCAQRHHVAQAMTVDGCCCHSGAPHAYTVTCCCSCLSCTLCVCGLQDVAAAKLLAQKGVALVAAAPVSSLTALLTVPELQPLLGVTGGLVPQVNHVASRCLTCSVVGSVVGTCWCVVCCWQCLSCSLCWESQADWSLK
jgi:hypothetical protein